MDASRTPPSAAAASADGGIEENAMAILDSSGIKDSRDLHDDQAAFLEAVRSACLAADNPSAPSCNSLELVVASFHLLLELGKQFPRTYLTNSGSGPALAVVKESWSPFLLGNGAVCVEGDAQSSDHLFDPSGSRKLVFKSFVKNCMFTLLNQYRQEAKDAVEDSIPSEGASDVSSLNLSFQLERTLVSLRKLFVMVMNLDLIRKEADTLGLTSRSDGFRIPIMEVILDELTYNISYLSPFLSTFVEWKWKLEIILQYFSKYCGKTAVRTRRSDNSQQDLKLESVLSSFLTATSAKAIVKKMSSEVAQLLLAHAYQVCLSVQDDSSDTTAATEKIGATLQQISCNLISAFQNLRKVKPNIQISQFEKEALFTAATFSRKLKNQES
ncbi:hypothetical protein PR202_gb06979 [Eleusine coracana subsp. coracana]|uniref:Uncharacterized protein n=1 Tax=Eleusine coracana subsp. coracana TaxID=191504 RepID=A0AAV5E8K1_ELECO|nr:hypothetical protein PR202_gb06979 [Eleusine coracana subsp. coracana]